MYVSVCVCVWKFFNSIGGSAVLGNHDYRGDVEAQLSPVLTNLDKRWFCLRSYVVKAGENYKELKLDFPPLNFDLYIN